MNRFKVEQVPSLCLVRCPDKIKIVSHAAVHLCDCNSASDGSF